MQMQLGAVLPGRRGRRGETPREPAIERLAAFGIAQARVMREARSRLQPRYAHERAFGAGSREADDRDCGAPGAARESKDRVGR